MEMESYTDPSLLECYVDGIYHPRPAWADPDYNKIAMSFRKNRFTYHNDGVLKTLKDSMIDFDKDGKPLFPGHYPNVKRYGRGVLGKWGPNHAADPIAIRVGRVWFKECYYALVIKRKDTNEWAFPGGMVDPGESITQTLARELREEAADLPDGLLESFLNDKLNQIVLYNGINWTDPRNTFHAWMETSVVMFFIPKDICANMRLRPQASETLDARWVRMDSDFSLLYSDHGKFAKHAQEKLYRKPPRTQRGLIFLNDEIHTRNTCICVVVAMFALCVHVLVLHSLDWVSLLLV